MGITNHAFSIHKSVQHDHANTTTSQNPRDFLTQSLIPRKHTSIFSLIQAGSYEPEVHKVALVTSLMAAAAPMINFTERRVPQRWFNNCPGTIWPSPSLTSAEKDLSKCSLLQSSPKVHNSRPSAVQGHRLQPSKTQRFHSSWPQRHQWQ